jgi:hypothetical protein
VVSVVASEVNVAASEADLVANAVVAIWGE